MSYSCQALIVVSSCRDFGVACPKLAEVIVRHVGLERDPFLLTPALSPRRGSTIVRPAVDAERSDSSQDGIRFSLSPRERARVRGNGTAAWRPLFPWGSTSGYRPSAL
jgi:hypothetical protein